MQLKKQIGTPNMFTIYNSEAHLKGQRREICNPWCVYHTKVLVEYNKCSGVFCNTFYSNKRKV